MPSRAIPGGGGGEVVGLALEGGVREEVGGRLEGDLQEGGPAALDADAAACAVAPLRKGNLFEST